MVRKRRDGRTCSNFLKSLCCTSVSLFSNLFPFDSEKIFVFVKIATLNRRVTSSNIFISGPKQLKNTNKVNVIKSELDLSHKFE